MNRIWIAIGVVVVLGIGLLATRDGGKMEDATGTESPSPSPSASASPKAGAKAATPKPSAMATPNGTPIETTAKIGTYHCLEGKSFSLTTYADGSARVGGANSSNVVLHRSSLGIWQSDDAKVAVRVVAGYTILVENDKTTRDQCQL